MNTNNQKKKLLDALKENHIVLAACRKTDIGKSSYYRWREDPKFAKAADAAIQEGIELVNDAAESNIITGIKNRDKDDSKFWLKHRHPAYAAKLQIDAKIQQDEVPTPQQSRFIQSALRTLDAIDKEQPAEEGETHEQKTG
jgi:hypothetical protein